MSDLGPIPFSRTMKTVYVIYDPLYEKVLCVHNEEDMECEVCKSIREHRNDPNNGYNYTIHLEECERIVVKKTRDKNLEELLKDEDRGSDM